VTSKDDSWDRPPAELLAVQAGWLAPARSRLLRRVAIAHKRSVLDLGCGSGAVTAELARRARGLVVGADPSMAPLPAVAPAAVAARAERLPFADRSFDLVFSQCALMWMKLERALAELERVLSAGGHLVAVEPDYGGLIEEPATIATRELWLEAIERAGGDPRVGRRLPVRLGALGCSLSVAFLDRLAAPSRRRFELLRGLPLTDDEERRLDQAEQADAELPDEAKVVHLPFFLVIARKAEPGTVVD
jgi:SAM-dependent methyltransferase